MFQPDENVLFQNQKQESGRKTRQGSFLIELIDVQAVLSWPLGPRSLAKTSDGPELGGLSHEVPFPKPRLRFLLYQLGNLRNYSNSDEVVEMVGWLQSVVFVPLSARCDAEVDGTDKHTFHSSFEHNYCKGLPCCIEFFADDKANKICVFVRSRKLVGYTKTDTGGRLRRGFVPDVGITPTEMFAVFMTGLHEVHFNGMRCIDLEKLPPRT